MSATRDERILQRNKIIRQKFQKFASKHCYRIQYILELISKETGLHVEYIRGIIRGTNKTENRIRKKDIKTKPIDEK